MPKNELFGSGNRIPEPRSLGLDSLYLSVSGYDRSDDEYLVRAIRPMLASSEGPILDVGCNSGDFAHYLSTLTDRHIYAVDIDQNALLLANERYGNAGNLHFSCCDVYKLSESFSGFGIVFSMLSLHHFDNLDQAIGQMTSVLNQNGIITIYDWDRNLARPEIDNCGLSQQAMDELYEAHLKSSESTLHKILKRRRLLNDLSIATFFSVLAAYTMEEVVMSLDHLGFYSETTAALDEAKFYIGAYKLGRFKRALRKLF